MAIASPCRAPPQLGLFTDERLLVALENAAVKRCDPAQAAAAVAAGDKASRDKGELFDAVGVSNSLWSFSKMKRKRPLSAPARSALTDRVVALAGELNSQDLTNTVVGLASVVGGGASAVTLPLALQRRMGVQAATMKPQG